MILIISFSLMVLVATLTQQLRLVIGIYLCVMTLLSVSQFYTRKSDYILLWSVTMVTILLIISMTYFHHRYDYQYSPKETVIATGVIVEKNINKYTIKLEDQSQWIYYSRRVYDLGDQILTFATYTPWYTGNHRQQSRSSLNLTRPSMMTTWWEYQFDYNKYQLMKWLQGTLYEKQAIMLAQDQWGYLLYIKKKLQQQIVDTYGSNKTSALILGMLIWDKSLLTKSDYQQFIDTGIVHIIAVSGGNIAILIWFLMIVLFFLPYYVRIAVIAIVVVCYCLICGMDSSVVRAMIMWLLSIGALMMGKMTSMWKILSLTRVSMLLYNPYFLVYDLGFGFSFWAVVGIVILSESFDLPRNRRWSLVTNMILPGIWATIGILPLMIFAIGKLNLTGIVGNLFVTPIISIVMVYGAISTYLYWRLGLERIKLPEQRSVHYIYRISDMIRDYSLTMIVSGRWIRWLFLISMIIALVRYKTLKHPHITSKTTPDILA